MDLRALRYFIETVRRDSFTQAAQALNVTQSTISKMVRQLEAEIGSPLLIRQTRGVRLTDVGRVVYEQGQHALGAMQGLQRELADLTRLHSGELTLGLPPMVNGFFPPLIQHFRARHPGVRLTVEEAGGDVIEARVAAGELEVGVSVLPLHEPDAAQAGAKLATAELGRFPICLVATADAHWTKLKRPGLAHLDGLPVVVPAAGFALGRHLREAWQRAGVSPKVVAQSSQWDFLLSMAESGMGTAVLPQPLLQRLKLPDHLVVRALPARELSWVVAHVWAADRYLGHAARAWLACCGVRRVAMVGAKAQ